MKGKYQFVVAFAKSMAEGEKFTKMIGKHLKDDAQPWLAYPKGHVQEI